MSMCSPVFTWKLVPSPPPCTDSQETYFEGAEKVSLGLGLFRCTVFYIACVDYPYIIRCKNGRAYFLLLPLFAGQSEASS